MKLTSNIITKAATKPFVVIANPKCCTVNPATDGPIKFPRKKELVQAPTQKFIIQRLNISFQQKSAYLI